jgi:hypothetical protein
MAAQRSSVEFAKPIETKAVGDGGEGGDGEEVGEAE